MNSSYADILSTVIPIAHEAGAVVRRGFPRTALTDVEFKGAVNPVTATDEEAEALILARLRAAFPHHRFLAEESGGDEWLTAGPPIWLVDPLDGTNNFAHAFPHVSVSLALVTEGRPVVGVAYDPLRDETFAATAGGGTTLNGEPVHVSTVGRLASAFLATGFPYDRRTAADNNVARLDHFLRRSQGVRRAGSAVLDLAYVACGRFDGFWEIRLHPWDVAAGVLLVREAGGRATDFEGQLDYLSGEAIVASNGHVHAEMLRVIRDGAAAPLPDSGHT
ncbi:MAG TPA: inositol monophosphatase [Chloroflexi bacterium]|nr:inositol monophosphatase [Chloroflexota bacterium]